MRVNFYTFDGNEEREFEFAELMRAATRAHGDDFDAVSRLDTDDLADVAVCLGVRAETRAITELYRAAGKRSLVLDKGAIRTHNRSDYKRVYMDGGTSLAYMHRRRRPTDRFDKLAIKLHSLREPSKRGHIIYAANSQKVADYWRMGDVHDASMRTIRQIQKLTRREVVYRPKPRALDFCEEPDLRYSLKPETIDDALRDAHCLVTHTSHCTVNALIAGVPCVVLGPNVARGFAGKYIEQIVDPPFPTEYDRYRFFCNLAWCQWSNEEFKSGEAWDFIKGELAATLPQP